MRRAWALARIAADAVWHAPFVAAVAGVAVLVSLLPDSGRSLPIEPTSPSTWPLVPLILSGLWGGLVAGGGSRARMVHAVARPGSRFALPAARVGVLVVAQLAVGLFLFGLCARVTIDGSGPPLSAIVATTIITTLAGTTAGAVTEHEGHAVGAAAFILCALLAPPLLLIDALGISWARIDSAISGAELELAVTVALTLLAPTLIAWSRLPRRTAVTSVAALLTVAAVSVLHMAAVWWPAASAAALANHGEPLAVMGMPGERPISVTGTRSMPGLAGSPRADGVASGATGLFEGSRLAEWSEVVDALPSPGQRYLALSLETREAQSGFEVRVLSVPDGATVWSSDRPRTAIAGWSPSGSRLALADERIAVVDVPSGEVRVVSEAGGRAHGWSTAGLVFSTGEALLLAGLEGTVRPLGNLAAGNTAVVGPTAAGWVVAGSSPPRNGITRQGVDVNVVELHRRQRTRPQLDLEASGEMRAVGWLDADHLALVGPLVGDGASRRSLVVIDRYGTIITRVRFQHSHRTLVGIFGPADGPWLLVGRLGTVRGIDARGSQLWHHSVIVFGDPARPTVPLRFEATIIEGIDPRGHHWREQLPWIEEDRR